MYNISARNPNPANCMAPLAMAGSGDVFVDSLHLDGDDELTQWLALWSGPRAFGAPLTPPAGSIGPPLQGIGTPPAPAPPGTCAAYWATRRKAPPGRQGGGSEPADGHSGPPRGGMQLLKNFVIPGRWYPKAPTYQEHLIYIKKLD